MTVSSGTLRDLVAAATPPDHGEDTWERKMAWDRSNEAHDRLGRIMGEPSAAVLLADAVDWITEAGCQMPCMHGDACMPGYCGREPLLARFRALEERADERQA